MEGDIGTVLSQDTIEKVMGIKLFVMDVDGVLTDGKIVYDDSGKQLKFFDVKDGHGIKLLMRGGVKTAIITARKSQALLYRTRDLGINTVYQGAKSKMEPFAEIVKNAGLEFREVAYIGDDVIDLPLLRRAGFSVAVADAVDEVKEYVDYATRRNGGCGAVREVCELILKVQGKWGEVTSRYFS